MDKFKKVMCRCFEFENVKECENDSPADISINN